MLRICKLAAKRNFCMFSGIFVQILFFASTLRAAPQDNTGATWQPPRSYPEFPSLPVQGPFLRQQDMMSLSTQEDLFVRRDLLENYYGEYLAGARNQIHRNAQIDIVNQLRPGDAISEVELRKAYWERDTAQLSGEISGLQAETLLIYEEMALIRLRVMAGEDVFRENLLRFQVRVHEVGVTLAEKRLARAKAELNYRRFRWEAVRKLSERDYVNRQELLSELIDFVEADQMAATETRRLELSKASLEIVRRQAGL